MSLVLDSLSLQTDTSRLERAILETLAYSDIFEYPLTMEEIHRFLGIHASLNDVRDCLADMDGVSRDRGYYFLAGSDEFLNARLNRQKESRKAYERALLYGRILGHLPFIRMAALTGSLAMLNLSKNRDMDYMLVAQPGHVWTARAFALLLGRIAKIFGDEICPNVIISENALEWNARNIYTAHEFAQMIPVSGLDVFTRLLDINLWVQNLLPNSSNQTLKVSNILDDSIELPKRPLGFFTGISNLPKQLLEKILGGRLGNQIESWEMNRKITRFNKQKGFGLETNFNADVCQGNFDHHGSWALQAFEERLQSLGISENSS